MDWIGHDPDPKWYPAANFADSPHLLRDFHAAYPGAAGPPKWLHEWICAWEQDKDLEKSYENELPA
jgi:hypothetical protein